jgi:hypothetical protein
MNYKSLIITLLAMSQFAIAQDCITINTVVSFTPGEGQNLGQGDEFFPNNIFGRPSENASEQAAAASESEVLSLGMGGEIIVANSENVIIDGEGDDFTIFENAFVNPINQRIFAEPGVVNVSKDGVDFVEFPYNFATLEGCAGTTPTYGEQDYCDSEVSGGNSFDLSDIGIDSVRYIKIRDLTVEVAKNQSHKYYAISLSGFDLDALVLHNYTAKKISSVATDSGKRYTINNRTYESKSNTNRATIFKLNGEKIAELIGVERYNFSNLNLGVYLITIENNGNVFYEKIINY